MARRPVEPVSTGFGIPDAEFIRRWSDGRGDAKVGSDIDVLVVVRQDSFALRQALADLAWQVQFEYSVVISDIIRSVEQFNRMQANRFPFYQNIEREGVLLWKSTSEPTPVYA